MKNYTVKEVAELLKTDPETVRRWIRSGKLQATKSSRKSGHVIEESMLDAFLESSPKYASTFMHSTSPVAGTIFSVLLGGGLATKLFLENRNIKNSNIDSSEIIRLAKEKTLELNRSIEKKQQKILSINAEIEQCNHDIDMLNELITNLSLETKGDN